MKNILILVLSLIVLAASMQINAVAETDEQYDNTVYEMGDVNCDGEVDSSDCLDMMKILTNTKRTYMTYEAADLNGDCAFSLKDVLILKKKIANIDVEINTKRFFKPDEDITDELEDLGKNNYSYGYDDSNYQKIVSRNPYDMIAVRDMVMVSGGNYQDNTGPVRINAYKRNLSTSTPCGDLDTEQINRFYLYNNTPITIATDPKTWLSASVYYFGPKLSFWNSKFDVIKECIHCYDMAQHNGKLFFCGSAVNYDSNYKNSSGNTLELSKGSIYLFTGESINKATSGDFKEVELINKFGDVITYASNTMKSDNGDYYYSLGVPRVYDLYEIGDELYALYYDQYINLYDEEYNFNGFYKYDDEKGQFIYDNTLSIKYITDVFDDAQDAEKIQHDFEWNGTHYFITRGLFATKDLKEYNTIVIPEYEDYVVRDAIVRNGKVYLLAEKDNGDDTFTNVVLETEDFENYRPILHFSAKSFARSFEFCNGAFYFGLGAHLVRTNPGKWPAEYDINEECGRIYRYVYYK